MKNFWRGVAMVLLYVIGGALLIYAASRSLDFISSTLPGNQQIVGFLGLAATSGGMIAWLMLFMFCGSSQSGSPRSRPCRPADIPLPPLHPLARSLPLCSTFAGVQMSHAV